MSPGGIALGYAVIAILWIAFSDAVVTHFKLHPALMTIKGTVFVFVTASLLYFTIRRLVKAIQLTSQGLLEQAALLNLTHDTVFVVDMEGIIKYWNRGAEEQYGWKAEQAVGKVVHDLLKTVFPLPFDEIKSEVARTGRWEGELLHTNKYGAQLAVASRLSLQRDRHGAPFAILETNNDISERKRAEEALFRLNRELRAISYCNHALLRATDEQSLLHEVCRIIYEEAGYHPVWVGYVEHDEAKSVRPVSWAGTDKEYLDDARISWSEDDARGRGPTGAAIRSGKTCCSQDFATDSSVEPWREMLLQGGFRSAISLPLKDEHANVLGCLSMHSERPQAFTPEETRLLEELAGDMAFGVVTLRSRAARKQAVEALREREAYLAEAQRLSHTGSWAFDVCNNRYIYASEECLRIFGFEPHTALPTRGVVCQRIHPDDAERVDQHFDKTIREKLDSSNEFRLVLPDGAVKDIQVIGHPVLNSAGEIVQLVGTAMDVTERKRAEEEVRNTAAQWQATFDAVQDLVLLLDKDFRILRANRAVTQFLGLPFDKIVGGHCYDLIHGASTSPAECPLAKMRQSRRHEESEVLARKRGPWLSVSVDPLLDASGELIQVVHVARDITERKRAEEDLRESETRFRTFVDHAGDALFVYDFERTTVVDVNRRACEELGYTREELIGSTLLKFHLDGYQAELESVTQRALAGETVFDTHWHRRKDGSTFPAEVHTSLVSYRGGRFLLMVARDITDRLQAEEQREKLRQVEADLAHINRVSMLGELAASVGHELKQPISAATLHAEICLQWLRRDQPDIHEASEAATRILDATNRADEIIDNLRSLYKKSPAKRELVDANQRITQMVTLLLEQAGRHAVSIRTELADSLPEILADPVQLQQVLMNLMLNAIQAMHDTGGVLTLKSQLVQDERVEISVSDTGIGLPAGKVDQIFNAFFTTKAQGSGMGLSISRSIVEAHGGRIWATSNDGDGATFHFALPIAAERQVLTAV